MNLKIVYITAKDKKEAKKIAQTLVKEKLAVCVNIFSEVDSIYTWEGQIKDETEVVLIAKVKGSMVEELIQRVKEMHSYDCPCIVTLPIEGGHKPYLDWLAG